MATTDFTNGVTLTDAAWFDDIDCAGYAVLSGVAGTNTITATGPATYTYAAARPPVWFIPANTNTGATTINVTPSGGAALGAKNLFLNGRALAGGELLIGVPTGAVYDGTQFNIVGNGYQRLKLAPSGAGRNIAARTNAAAPTTTIDMTADELIVTNATGNAARLTTVSVSPIITASGENGLDTGNEAGDTWYYGWVIAKEDGTVAGLLSVSATAPTLPAGYTFKALVTAVRNNNSSNFIAYRQFGSEVFYEALQNVLNAGSSTGEATVSVATAVPPIAHKFLTEAILTGTTDGSGIIVLTATLRFITSVNWTSIAIGLNGLANTTGQNPAGGMRQIVFPNVSQQFFYQITVTNGSAQAMTVDVLGFKLPMGGS